MCYDVSQQLTAAYKRAKHKGDEAQLKKIVEKMQKYGMPLYHASGFSHPTLLHYTQDKAHFATWGLIPRWVKSEEQAYKLWNITLNARSETLYDKPSFKHAAEAGRCIIPVNGFFEHHINKQGKKEAHFVQLPEGEVMHLAGLREEWVNPAKGEIVATCTVVTTAANAFMAELHNTKEEGRMPVVLSEVAEELWLSDRKQDIEEATRAYAGEMKSHVVKSLRGKNYLGNVEAALEEHKKGNASDQLSLF